MERRRFVLTSLAAALIALRAADAQQTGKVHRLGFLSSAAPPAPSDPTAGWLLNPLRDLGYVEGRNLVVERRYANNDLDRLPALARELVATRLDVIVVVGGTPARAVRSATQTVPIVMAFGPPDPVGAGLVTSLAAPGGNITGIAYWPERGSEAKRLELLKQAAPEMRRPAFLTVAGGMTKIFVDEVQEAAGALKITLIVVEVKADQYDRAFAAMQTARADALLVQGAPPFNRDRKRIIELAARHRLPAIYEWRHHAEDGGLMSYGGNLRELYQRVASYIDRILRGANPAEMPIEQPTKFELVVNLKTARALGLTIPPSLVARADYVIE